MHGTSSSTSTDQPSRLVAAAERRQIVVLGLTEDLKAAQS